VKRQSVTDWICIELIRRGLIVVDPATGAVASKRFCPPKAIGCLNAAGYLVATLHFQGHRRQIKLHRIVWLAINGPIADGFVIDHINRNKSDNRIANLRLADSLLNASNRRSYRGGNNPAAKITKAIADGIKSRH